MRFCVYTCITGGYDNLKEINYKNDELDYLCFTNNKSIKSNTWEIVYVEENIDDLLLSRKIKMLYYEYLEGYDASLYIDGKVFVRKDITTFIIDNLKDDVDMVGFRHPFRDCLYDEMHICVLLNKEKLDTTLFLKEMYEKEGFPHHYGLSDNAVMLRRHNDSVRKLMDDWYYMFENYTRRDQLSLFYCLWKNPIKTVFLDENIEDNDYFLIDTTHTPQSEHRKTRYLVDFNTANSHDVTLMSEGYYDTELFEVSIEIKVPAKVEDFSIRIYEKGYYKLDCSVEEDLKIEQSCGIPLNSDTVFADKAELRVAGNIQMDMIIHLNMRITRLTQYQFEAYLNQCNYQRFELETIKGSSSWRVTAPLRNVANGFRDKLKKRRN